MENARVRIKTMKIPIRAQGSEDRLFLWLRGRYRESGSVANLKDIERLASRNMHAAYWMSQRLSEIGDNDGAREWLWKASDLGCDRASVKILLGLDDEYFDDLEEIEWAWRRFYRPLGRSLTDLIDDDGRLETDSELETIVTEAAETDWRMNLLLMWDALREDRAGELRERSERGAAEGHAVAMWVLANDLVLEAKSCLDGKRAERIMARAIGLFEDSQNMLWHSSRDLGVQLFCSRGVERDIPRAAECFLDAAERGSGEALRWLDFLTSGPSVDELGAPEIRWRTASEDISAPDYFAVSPEWQVLRDVTGSNLESEYPQLCNEWGGFENDVFSIVPDYVASDRVCGRVETEPFLVFKPTGFKISWNRSPKHAYMSQDIGWDRLSMILRVCIDSACESIRGLDA